MTAYEDLQKQAMKAVERLLLADSCKSGSCSSSVVTCHICRSLNALQDCNLLDTPEGYRKGKAAPRRTSTGLPMFDSARSAFYNGDVVACKSCKTR